MQLFCLNTKQILHQKLRESYQRITAAQNIVTLYIIVQKDIQSKVNRGIIHLKTDCECYVQSTKSFCEAVQ